MRMIKNPQQRRRIGLVAAATLAAGTLISLSLPSSEAARR